MWQKFGNYAQTLKSLFHIDKAFTNYATSLEGGVHAKVTQSDRKRAVKIKVKSLFI